MSAPVGRPPGTRRLDLVTNPAWLAEQYLEAKGLGCHRVAAIWLEAAVRLATLTGQRRCATCDGAAAADVVPIQHGCVR